MNVGERIKMIRTDKKLTLEKFGERLGVTKASISRIEKNERALTDQMCLSICREFNVSEKWLRTGEGTMFIELDRDAQIARFIGEALKDEDDSFKKQLIHMFSKLDESEWKMLEQVVIKMQEKRD